MKIQESGENYLETILILKQKNGLVRSIDIANKMGFTKPSISRAVSLLKSANLITVGRDGAIELTEEGLDRAGRVYERHRTLTRFLTSIGVAEQTAAEDACRMEHVISEESFEKIKLQLDKEK